MPLVLTVLYAELAEVLALADLTKLATGQAHVVVEIFVICIEAWTETRFLFRVFLILNRFEPYQVCLLAFHFITARFCLRAF